MIALLLLFACLGEEADGEIVCTEGDATYSVGDSFPAADGCNTCTCGEDGQIGCTKIGCEAS